MAYRLRWTQPRRIQSRLTTAFDHTGLGIQPISKSHGHPANAAVGDPRAGIDAPIGDQSDDPGKNRREERSCWRAPSTRDGGAPDMGKESSACVIPTYTSLPAKAQYCRAWLIDRLDPVASTTTCANSPRWPPTAPTPIRPREPAKETDTPSRPGQTRAGAIHVHDQRPAPAELGKLDHRQPDGPLHPPPERSPRPSVPLDSRHGTRWPRSPRGPPAPT